MEDKDYNKTKEMLEKENRERLRKEEQAKCDHYFIASGGKWSSETQRTCCNCGLTLS